MDGDRIATLVSYLTSLAVKLTSQLLCKDFAVFANEKAVGKESSNFVVV